MDYRKEPLRAEGATKSNPWAGFEAYSTAPAQNVVDTPAEDRAEGDKGPRGGGVSGDTSTYETA